MDYEFQRTRFNNNPSKYNSSIVFKYNKDTYAETYTSQPVTKVLNPISLELYNKSQSNVFATLLIKENTFPETNTPISRATLLLEEKNFINKPHADVRNGYKLYFDTIETFYFERVNSNIYKNIFANTALNMDVINTLEKNVKTTSFDKIQDNYGFVVGDVLYQDENKIYHKAIAEDSIKSIVVGIVSNIPSENVFTLITSGVIEYSGYNYTDSSILYLSDKNPGGLTHYLGITNTVYVPVAIYANNKIIINIVQGSVGDEMEPYTEYIDVFEEYTREELDNVILQIRNKVII